MYLKQLLTKFVPALLLLLVLPGGIIMAADSGMEQHENPDLATQDFDNVAILGYYTMLLDDVIAKAPTEVESLLDKRPFANIPEDLEGSLETFGNASVDISWLISDIEAELDNLNLLTRQFLLEEAKAQRQQTQDKLARAFELLPAIEKSAATASEELGVPSSQSGSSLKIAYEELQNRIDQLRKLLGLLQALLEALPEETLQELVQGLPENITPEQLASLLEKMLCPTDITLAIESNTVFVGDGVGFEGRLTCADSSLPNREVVLLLNGVPYLNCLTGSDGSYQGRLQIPYNYVPSLTLQALYYPQDKDIGVYLASKSTAADIQVLFHTATLYLQSQSKSYPGLDSILYGRFDYGDQPILAARDIEIYLDRKLVSRVNVGESFEQKISLGNETALGEHSLLVLAPAQNRYAPVYSETTLNVVKATPVIDVSPPRIAIMPLALNLKGRIYSELGPLKGATVKATFGSSEAQATTSQDGSFTLKLETGMNFSLVGSRELSIKANPTEPWDSPASISFTIVAINPILIGLLSLAIVAIIVTLVNRLRGKSRRPAFGALGTTPGVLTTKPASELVTQGSFHTSSQAGDNDLRKLIFELYRRLLGLIQDFTSIVLKPNLTLREFTSQCAPLLGPAQKYLDQFTSLIERLLYSKHSPEPADLEKGLELGGMIEGSLKHDRT
jgi:hypothetical protein